jgi:hypothetical protein
MIIGYKVEYSWWHYPVDKLEIQKKYAKTYDEARKIFEDILSKHYYNARIVPIERK